MLEFSLKSKTLSFARYLFNFRYFDHTQTLFFSFSRFSWYFFVVRCVWKTTPFICFFFEILLLFRGTSCKLYKIRHWNRILCVIFWCELAIRRNYACVRRFGMPSTVECERNPLTIIHNIKTSFFIMKQVFLYLFQNNWCIKLLLRHGTWSLRTWPICC